MSKRKFNFDDIDDNFEFKRNDSNSKTTTDILDIGENLRSKRQQIPCSQNDNSDNSVVKKTTDKPNFPVVKNTTEPSVVKNPVVKMTTVAEMTTAKTPSVVKMTTQDIEPWEYFFSDLIWFVFRLPITAKEMNFLIALLSFKRLSFSFSNSDLGDFFVSDRSNAYRSIVSLEAKGCITRFSEKRKKQVINISPLLDKYFNYKEVYDVSPEDFFEEISTFSVVKNTTDSLLVRLGYIYTKDTKNIKQDIPNSDLEVKTIKLSSTEKIMWQELVQTFSLFGINLDKISQDTFDFVRGIPNDTKARHDFTDAVIYTVLSQGVKNPYNYLKAAYNNRYFSKLTEEQRSQVLNICQLLKQEKTTLQEFLLEGGLKRVKETAQALGISFKNMITTVDIITQRVGTARKTFHDFELKYKIEYMTWKEELHKPSF